MLSDVFDTYTILATEITDRMRFKSFALKDSVHAVADNLYLRRINDHANSNR